MIAILHTKYDCTLIARKRDMLETRSSALRGSAAESLVSRLYYPYPLLRTFQFFLAFSIFILATLPDFFPLKEPFHQPFHFLAVTYVCSR